MDRWEAGNEAAGGKSGCAARLSSRGRWRAGGEAEGVGSSGCWGVFRGVWDQGRWGSGCRGGGGWGAAWDCVTDPYASHSRFSTLGVTGMHPPTIAFMAFRLKGVWSVLSALPHAGLYHTRPRATTSLEAWAQPPRAMDNGHCRDCGSRPWENADSTKSGQGVMGDVTGGARGVADGSVKGGRRAGVLSWRWDIVQRERPTFVQWVLQELILYWLRPLASVGWCAVPYVARSVFSVWCPAAGQLPWCPAC